MTQNNQQASNQRLCLYMTKRRCIVISGVILSILFMLFIVLLVLAFTVFKVKDPRTQLRSVAVDGIVPRISFPVIRVELNITLDLKLEVDNPNHASFKHWPGNSRLTYRGNEVGQVDMESGYIPAKGSTDLGCRLTLDVNEIASNMALLIRDVLVGELVVETHTRIPGRVSFLGGLFKKHVVAISECQMAIGIPDMTIRREECKRKTKF